ncbi:MAG: hypothetical protein AB4080_05830 [Trichodesmium sp.]
MITLRKLIDILTSISGLNSQKWETVLDNADVNGSLNILRKAVPNAFSNGIEGVVVHPVKVTLN